MLDSILSNLPERDEYEGLVCPPSRDGITPTNDGGVPQRKTRVNSRCDTLSGLVI